MFVSEKIRTKKVGSQSLPAGMATRPSWVSGAQEKAFCRGFAAEFSSRFSPPKEVGKRIGQKLALAYSVTVKKHQVSFG